MKEAYFDKIEAYLNGAMTQEEVKSFDENLHKDPELATAMDQYLTGNDAVELLIEDSLRADMESWKQEEHTATKVVPMMQQKKTATFRSLTYRLALAASVAMLIGFFGLQFANQQYSNGAILASVDSPYDFSKVRATTTVDHPFQTGINAYEAANYSAAIDFFQGIPATDGRYAEAQFYLGHSLHQNKNYAEAIAAFQQVVASNNMQFKEAAEWQQLVSGLANDNLDTNFTTLLNKLVADDGHVYHHQATLLNQKLNSFWRVFK